MEGRGLDLPAGYRLDDRDAELCVLRREDGSEVAAFSVTGADPEQIERRAWEDHRHHQRPEVFKLRFEFFKHVTTLSTAAALVVLAVYRPAFLRERLRGIGVTSVEAGEVAETAAVLGTLAFLGLAMIVSVLGMALVVLKFQSSDEAVDRWLERLVWIDCLLALLAVVMFLQAAFAPYGRWFVWGLAFAVVSSLGLLILRDHIGRRGASER